ncbi:MAG: hypothetical protein BroJett018_48150 [Chloroflexota bacterium]|nr:DUF5050 domain-containing protein [Chloroflexota bacterium]GIK67021.1 MAG: hypothetical protein BroJett018_48150 [Chloroflexota bacterium]
MWRVALKMGGMTLLLLCGLLWLARRNQHEELWLIYSQTAIGEGGIGTSIGRVRWNDLAGEPFTPDDSNYEQYKGIVLQPDGWLVYREDNIPTRASPIFQMRPNGVQRRISTALPHDATPAGFSPDGEWMYYTKRDNIYHRQLYRMRLDGSHVEQLAEEISNADVAIVDWSSDNQWVYLQYGADLESVEASEIARMRPDGSDFQFITEGNIPFDWENQSVGFAGLSSDNQWVYYYTYAGIYRIRPDGSDIRFVIPGRWTRLVGWSADGQWIIARLQVGDDLFYFRASVTQSTIKQLGKTALRSKGSWWFDAWLSPSRKLLVYQYLGPHNPPTGELLNNSDPVSWDMDLMLAPTDGSLPTILTAGMYSESVVGWSPDEQWVIISVRGQLYRVHLDSTKLEKLPAPYDSSILGWWTMPKKSVHLGWLAVLAVMLVGLGYLPVTPFVSFKQISTPSLDKNLD